MSAVTCFARLVRDVFPEEPGRWHLGGGAWGAFGAALVSDDVRLASGVGPDPVDEIATLARLGISDRALVRTHRPTATTELRYIGQERIEHPVGGFAEHDRMELSPTDVTIQPGGSAYLLRPLDDEFWPAALAHLKAMDIRVGVELHLSTCAPAYVGRTRDLASSVALVSLNIVELSALGATTDGGELFALFDSLPSPHIAVRLGSAGSLVRHDGAYVHITPPPTSQPVDPTGAGNAYTGAYLAALADDRGLPAVAATAAAATAIGQMGMPENRAAARATFAAHAAASFETPLDTTAAIALLEGQARRDGAD